jgi:hypothetical protein
MMLARAGAVLVTGAAAALGPGCGSNCATRALDVPVAAAAGESQRTACAIVQNGRVHCWYKLSAFWVPGLDDALSTATAEQKGCAVRRARGVACWNTSLDSRGERVVVWHVPVDGASRVAATQHAACALLRDGSVTCWDTDVLVDEAMQPKHRTDLSDAVLLTANVDRFFALRRGGAVVSFAADPKYGPPLGVATVPEATQIVAGDDTWCALTRGGEVECWGSNWMGALGNGSAAPDGVSSPTPVFGLSGVVEIAGGRSHTCARHADGSVDCWGSNQYGQIGVDSTGLSDARPRPTRVPYVTAASLAGGSCVLTPEQRLVCWGWNRGTNRMDVCAEKGKSP